MFPSVYLISDIKEESTHSMLLSKAQYFQFVVDNQENRILDHINKSLGSKMRQMMTLVLLSDMILEGKGMIAVLNYLKSYY